MADSNNPQAEASAEKAYAEAAAVVADKAADAPENASPVPVPAPTPAIAASVSEADPVEFPAKPKRGRKPRPEPEITLAVPAAAPAPVALIAAAPMAAAAIPVVGPVSAAKPAKLAVRIAPQPAPAKRLAKRDGPVNGAKAPAAKPAPITLAPAKSKPVKMTLAKAGPAKLVPAKLVPGKRTPPVIAAKINTILPAQPKASSPGAADKSRLPFIVQLKDIPMDVTSSIKDAVSGAQEKAKEAFTKTSAAATEYGEFAKGNAEAFVESGKILASGLKALGTTLVADGKSAFETASADVKSLSSVKSPTDLFQLQSDLLRRNFDSAVAFGSKTSEAMMKLTNDMMAPISTRVNLAVEKVKTAA